MTIRTVRRNASLRICVPMEGFDLVTCGISHDGGAFMPSANAVEREGAYAVVHLKPFETNADRVVVALSSFLEDHQIVLTPLPQETDVLPVGVGPAGIPTRRIRL